MIDLGRLTERVWCTPPFGETDRPLLAIVIGDERALMIDAGNSPRHAGEFLAGLAGKSLPYPDYVAITHAHCDHFFGLSVISRPALANSLTRNRIEALAKLDWNDEAVAARVANGQAHAMTLRMLQVEYPGDRSDLRLIMPEIVYENMLRIDLGGTTCILERIGGDHAKDSTVIHVPDQRVLFLGDCLYLRNVNQCVVNELFDKLLGFEATIFLDSHEDNPITRESLEDKRRELLKEM